LRLVVGTGAGLRVDVEALTAAGKQVAAPSARAVPPVTVEPAALDTVSAGVAQTLSTRISAIMGHSVAGAQIAGTAGAVVQANAATYRDQEHVNAQALRLGASAPGAVSTSVPAVRTIPSVPPAVAPTLPAGITPTDGKMIAELIHSGPGPQSLRSAAEQLRAHAGGLRISSIELRSAAMTMADAWQSDAGDTATQRIHALARWYDNHATHAENAARIAADQADVFAQTRAAVPRPQEFDDLRQRLIAAERANIAYRGAYSSVVTQLQAQLQATDAKARTAYADYSTRAADVGTDTSAPPPRTVQAVPMDDKEEPGEPGEGEEGPLYSEEPPPEPPARKLPDGEDDIGHSSAIVTSNVKTISKVPLQTDRGQIERKFYHAGDFGVTDPRGSAGFDNFARAVTQEVDDPGTIHIQGTYRGDPAILNYNPSSGLCVIQSPDGKFISGWNLSFQQAASVETTGKLGGG
jgi:hypothetical protein